jgi:TolB-like protein
MMLRGLPEPRSEAVHPSRSNGVVDGIPKAKDPAAITRTSNEAVSEEAIRDELCRILDSTTFIQSNRLSQFLRFTVEMTLEGKAETLKEYLIGTAVYDRNSSYQPNEDSIVRTEARRLRRKLKEYYESMGKDDPVLIEYRPGRYVPLFRLGYSEGNEAAKRNAWQGRISIGGRVAVLPFVDASRGTLSGAFAQFVTDELIHELVRTSGLHVTAATSMAPLLAQGLDIPSLARKLDVQIFFEGAVHESNNQLRIISRVVNAEGFQIWSERFETERDPEDLFKVSERIASALISRFSPELSSRREQLLLS